MDDYIRAHPYDMDTCSMRPRAYGEYWLCFDTAHLQCQIAVAPYICLVLKKNQFPPYAREPEKYRVLAVSQSKRYHIIIYFNAIYNILVYY